jgi:1-acyl-sn-glycerol-3-phosphate acyltransferase
MRRLQQIFKFILVFATILVYFAIASVIQLAVRDTWKRRGLLTQLVTFLCRISMSIFNFEVVIHGKPHEMPPGSMFVGNHQTYFDVLVFGSVLAGSFVTSKEIERTPFLGHICRLAGCVFVDRKNKFNLADEVLEISTSLEHDLHVVIFPEATSTNGEEVLRFRRPMFKAAQVAQRAVVPFCINYRSLDGVPLSKQNRDLICWYGDMDFVPHLWKLTGVRRGVVDIHFLESFSMAAGADLTEIANAAHDVVSRVFKPYR